MLPLCRPNSNPVLLTSRADAQDNAWSFGRPFGGSRVVGYTAVEGPSNGQGSPHQTCEFEASGRSSFLGQRMTLLTHRLSKYFRPTHDCNHSPLPFGKVTRWFSLPLTWKSATSSSKAFVIMFTRTGSPTLILHISCWSCICNAYMSLISGLHSGRFPLPVEMSQRRCWCTSAVSWDVCYGWVAVQIQGWPKDQG